MPLRMLVVGNTPNARTTGMGRCIHGLRDEWIRSGHEVDLLMKDEVPTVPTRRLQTLFFPFLFLFSMRSLWKKKGPHHVVHIHSTDAAVYVFLKRWFFKHWPPCIVISYGADELRWELELEEEKLGLWEIKAFSKLFYPLFIVGPARYATKHCDHVFCAASHEIQFYQKRYGVDPSKVSFVSNGVGDEFFVPRDYKASKKLLFFGGWEWRKGTRYLAEAFTELAKQEPEVSLTIVGTMGDESSVLSDFSEEVRGQVNVIPRVEPNEVLAIYKEHDIFVFPSLFESMSLVLPEAMATAMPVVTTNACGMKDIVEDEKSGFLVPVRNSQAIVEKVKLLLNDLELRKRIGEAAQKKAAEITWAKVAEQEIEVCKNLIVIPAKAGSQCADGETRFPPSRE